MDKQRLIKVGGYLVYRIIVICIGKYESMQGYDW